MAAAMSAGVMAYDVFPVQDQLEEFRNALQQQQTRREAHGHLQRIHGELDGAVGRLALVPGPGGENPRLLEEYPCEGKEKERVARRLDNAPGAWAQGAGDQVDPHMRLMSQRVAPQQHEVESEKLLCHVERPACRGVQRISHDDVVNDDRGEDDGQHADDASDHLVQAVYGTKQHGSSLKRDDHVRHCSS